MDKIDLIALEPGTIVMDTLQHIYMRIIERDSGFNGHRASLVHFVCQCGEYWTAQEVIDEAGTDLVECVITHNK